jgi:hypothetical protein
MRVDAECDVHHWLLHTPPPGYLIGAFVAVDCYQEMIGIYLPRATPGMIFSLK